MKYIQKLQGGGGFATFTPYLAPVQAQQVPASKSESSESVMDDKIYEKLVENGLVSDVNDFANKMNSLQTDTFGGGLFGGKPTTNYLQQIAKVNEIVQNKKAWDSSVKTAEATGGYGETAIGTNNEVYTRDKSGKIKAISLGTYKENKDAIKLLTVSELLNARNFEGQLAHQNSIFDVANNSVGLTEINKKVQSIVSALGEESEVTERHYSKEQIGAEMAKMMGIKKPSATEIEAFQTLREITQTPGEFYKVEKEETSKKRHLDKALNYIWTVLGKNEQQKLTLAGVMGGKDNPKEFLYDMLVSGTSATVKSKISPEGPIGGTSATGATGEKSLDQFQLFHNDKMQQVNNTFAMNDPKTSMLFRGVIGGISPIITADGKSVGMTTVKNILLNANYNQIVQSNNVYFGNKKVESSNLNNLIYNGEDAAKVYMPVGIGGAPDFEALSKFKDIYAVFEANKDKWDNTTAKNYFKKNGYNLEFEDKFEDGKRIKSIKENANVKPFLVMYGYTNDATGLTKNNPWITEFNSADKEIIPELESVWTVGEGKKSKNLTPDAWGWEDYYKGMITIPYKKESHAIVNAMVGQGPREKTASILDVQRNLNYSNSPSLNRNTSSLGLK